MSFLKEFWEKRKQRDKDRLVSTLKNKIDPQLEIKEIVFLTRFKFWLLLGCFFIVSAIVNFLEVFYLESDLFAFWLIGISFSFFWVHRDFYLVLTPKEILLVKSPLFWIWFNDRNVQRFSPAAFGSIQVISKSIPKILGYSFLQITPEGKKLTLTFHRSFQPEVDNLISQLNQLGSASSLLQPTPSVDSRVRFCTQCGQKLIPGNQFCPNCGRKLTNT